MATEDFTTYTEVDTNSKLTVTSSRVAWASLGDNQTAYLYIDKGTGFFSANFTHYLTVQINTGSQDNSIKAGWLLANVVGDLFAIEVAEGSYLTLLLRAISGSPYLEMEERVGDTAYAGDQYAISFDTPYYLTLKRDESAGTYGTLYLYVYSDSARTNLLTTKSSTLHEKADFRYIYAVNSRNDGSAQTQSGFLEELEVGRGQPTVTTQECTSVVAQSALGWGTITDLGSSAVTQHGHCWGTTTNPTTVLTTKTSLGAAPNLGQFHSGIAGLTPGTKYYIRAYATNTEGTSYGANVEIAGDVTTIGRRHVWTDGDELHWWAKGVHYKVVGSEVTTPIPWWIYMEGL